MAVVSTIGILCWMCSGYFGGMFIFLLSYWFLIIPIVILYILSFIETVIAISKKGLRRNGIKFFFHTLVFLAILLTNISELEAFKSKQIMTATLKDDQFHHTLILRSNGTCENKVSGIFGYHEVFHGKYELRGGTIFFTKIPYDNDFIPGALLIDKKQNAIFINKDHQGRFITTKEWLNHFEIHSNKSPDER